jgi:MGT family glycosyltransferase
MGRIVFGMFPAWGHVAPTVAIAQELVSRGHDVVYATHRAMDPRLEAAGLKRLPTFDWGGRSVLGQEHTRRHGLGLSWLVRVVRGRPKSIFLHELGTGAASFRQTLTDWRADLLVSDQLFSPGPIAAEAAGVPHATSFPNALPPWDDDLPPYGSGLAPDAPRGLRWRLAEIVSRWGARRMGRPINRVRRAHGLKPLERPLMRPSPYLGLAYLTGALEYPRPNLPPQMHLIGPSVSPRRGDHQVSFPWDWLDGRPLILLSMGTIFLSQDRFYREAAEACRGQGWQMVIRVGPGFRRPTPEDTPENVLFVDEQPQLDLLERSAIMISHAGVNSCVEALAAGVPLLLAPAALDQADFCQRVVRAGSGIRVSRRRPRAAEIRAGVQGLLAESSFRESARRIAADFARCDGPTVGADLLERLMATRQPVLRPPGSGMTIYADARQFTKTSRRHR